MKNTTVRAPVLNMHWRTFIIDPVIRTNLAAHIGRLQVADFTAAIKLRPLKSHFNSISDAMKTHCVMRIGGLNWQIK